jgi:hypothetical protein
MEGLDLFPLLLEAQFNMLLVVEVLQVNLLRVLQPE